jgi:hypothetical protein
MEYLPRMLCLPRTAKDLPDNLHQYSIQQCDEPRDAGSRNFLWLCELVMVEIIGDTNVPLNRNSRMQSTLYQSI